VTFFQIVSLELLARRRCINEFGMSVMSSNHLIVVVKVPVLGSVRDVFQFMNDDSPTGIGKSTLWIVVFDYFISTIARITSHLVEVSSDWIEDSLSVRIGASTSRTGVVGKRVLVFEGGICA